MYLYRYFSCIGILFIVNEITRHVFFACLGLHEMRESRISAFRSVLNASLSTQYVEN